MFANLLAEKVSQRAIPGFPNEAAAAVLDYLKFVELGAQSPDYPYLAIGDKKAKAWADLMHAKTTGRIIQVGVENIRALKGEPQRKGAAWMLGYTSHFTADACLHPVINRKVGAYEQNRMAHRVCEMHQDVFIFDKLNVGGLQFAEHLRSLKSCSSTQSKSRLDEDISALWRSILMMVYPAEYKKNVPDMDNWHVKFTKLVDNIAEEAGRLVPFARHVATGLGLMYPLATHLDRQYLEGLDTPTGKQDYEAIFMKALGHATDLWKIVAAGIYSRDAAFKTDIGNWNLDTGKDPAGHLVFWE
jgi:hypothetical protein